MYEKEKTLLLNSSASAIPGNVCSANINGKHYVGVIHKGELNIICTSGSIVEAKQVVCRVGTRNMQTPITLLQAAWVHVADQHILVLTTSVGVFMYEWDGSVLLFSHLLPQPSPEDSACFTRGIANLYPGFVYVGVHTGEILVFKVEDSAVSLLEKPRWHATAISTLHDHRQNLISGDEAGNIVVSEQKDDLRKLYMIDTYGSPVISIRNWEQYIIAGYMSGHLRIYSIEDGKIRAEVSAHARCITGLDVAEESGLLLSVAEDSFVRVWKLLENGINPIQHKYSTTLTNVLLCGGVFRDQLGSGFVATGYDLKEVICYRM